MGIESSVLRCVGGQTLWVEIVMRKMVGRVWYDARFVML